MSTIETTKELEYRLRNRKHGKQAVAITEAIIDWLDGSLMVLRLDPRTELCEMVADKLEEMMPMDIPTNWLDPLLTGPNAVIGQPPYNCADIEHLLNAIRQRQIGGLTAPQSLQNDRAGTRKEP